MPNRILRDWTDSLRVAQLSCEAERFFTRAIMKADDYGRFHADPRLLKGGLFPLATDVSLEDLSRWRDECAAAGVVTLYRDDRDRQFLEIHDFRQRTRAKASKFPEPCPSDDRHLTDERPPPAGQPRTESKTESEPKTITHPGRVSVPPLATGGDDFIERLWNAAPKMARERSSKVKVGKAWTRIPSPQRPPPDAAVAALESWKRSDSWTKDAGQFIPGLHRWIEERKWDDLPASLERPRPKAPPPDIPAEFIAWARQHSPSIGPAVAWNTPAIRARFENERE